jgi:hypothetical protein
LPCCGDRTEKDSSSLKYSEWAPSCILDRLMWCSRALSKKNSVFWKNSDKTPSRKQSLSLSRMHEATKSGLDWTSRAARIFWQVDLSLSLKWKGLDDDLNLRGDGLGACHRRLARRSTNRRWRLIPLRRSCCRGPSSSQMQICRNPLPGAPAVNVWPLIAYHEGTQGSMFGLQRMQNSMVNARDSRFILVRALDCDRVITLRPVGLSLCVGLIIKCRTVFFL